MTDKMIPVNSLFYINTKLFVNCMEGVTGELFIKRQSEESNNIAFISSHLLDARFYMAHSAGIEIVNPFKELFDRIKDPGQINDFPSAAEIVKVWKDISVEIEKGFGRLTETDLLKESAIQLPLTEKNVLGGIIFFLQHEAYHIGQIAVLRRMFGLNAMRYV